MADVPDANEVDAAGEQKFWERLGFESFQAYLDEINRLKDLYEPRRPPPGRPLTELPGEAVGEIGTPYRPEPRALQVNVKLRIAERNELNAAARIFGIAPSTLARLLVNRGVQAILDRET